MNGVRSLQLLSRGLMLALFGVVGLAGGCEAVVGDTIPSNVACTPGLGVCPAGYECVVGTCTACATPDCAPVVHDAGIDSPVVIVEAGHDTSMPIPEAGHDAGQDVGVDTGPPDVAVANAIGDPCSANTGCASDLCVSSADLNGVVVSGTSVCSLPCCTSADCGAGNVCYPTEAGSLCITATVAAGCGSTCGTSCCVQSDCGDGTSCAESATSFGGSVPSCQPSSSGDPSFCEQDSDCKEGVCDEDGNCNDANTCCSDSDCHGTDSSCQWLTVPDADGTSNPVFRGCNEPNQSGAPTGQPCTSQDDCADGFCLKLPGQTTTMCTQACCTNANCDKAVSHWICEPDSLQLANDSTVTVFVCGPPS